jgi:serine/threonine-protein kinase 24/25/MST4
MFLNPQTFLVDFGLCCHESKLRVTMLGSPYWMPPEMIRRQPHGYPTDVWSFGISLLELCNPHSPSCHSKLKAMFLVGTQGVPEPLEEPKRWSLVFKEFIKSCLEFDPAKRPSVDSLLKV